MNRPLRLTPGALALALLCGMGPGCSPEPPETPAKLDWITSLPQGLAKAKAENKLVLLHFTGSDWCPPCQALDRQVLSTANFKAYADTNLVLVEVDFPRKKEQPPALKQANEALQKQFNVGGFPTVILLDAGGKELSRQLGYGGARVADFIASLEKARNSKPSP